MSSMSVSLLILSNLAERRDMLAHRLRFLEMTGFTGDVLVGVWGGHEHIPQLQQVCSTFTQTKVTVVSHLGTEIFPKRLLDLAERARQAFVIAVGDDDFLVPAAFAQPIALLESDPGISCAQGRTMNLRISADGEHYQGEGFPLWDALESDPVERFTALMKHYTFSWHAIYRRAQFIERARYMVDMQEHSTDGVFFECIGDLYAVINGKIALCEELYMIRGVHDRNSSTTARQGGINYTVPPFLLLSPQFSACYGYFQSLVLKMFQAKGVDTTNEETLRNILKGLMYMLGHRFFKIRDALQPAEAAFQKMFNEQDPRIMTWLNVVHRAGRPNG